MMNKQRSRFLKLLVLLLALPLSGCFRMASLPVVDLSRLTPDAATAAVARPESADGTNAPAATPTPRLSSAVQTVLRAYPLWVGSSWVYDYLGYDHQVEERWRVTETVVATGLESGYYVAEVERQVELLSGDPGEDFRNAPRAGTFRVLIDGDQIYRFDVEAPTDPDNAWLDLVIPFPEDGTVWYPDPQQRALSVPPENGARTASAPFQQKLGGTGTYTCYNIATRYADGAAEGTFCETIGFVYQEYALDDQSYGFRLELIGFSLQ